MDELLKCKTCQMDTTLKYNGFPLCHQHYCQCIKNKVFKNLRQISPKQKLVVFGSNPYAVALLLSLIMQYYKDFVINIEKSVFLFVSNNIYQQVNQLMHNDNMQLGTFTNLLQTESNSYFLNLKNLFKTCFEYNINQIIDASTGNQIAKRAIQAIAVGRSFGLAINLTQQYVVYENLDKIEFNSTENLKSSKYNFKQRDYLSINRVLIQNGEDQLQQYFQVNNDNLQQTEDEISQHYININNIKNLKLDEVKCKMVCSKCSSKINESVPCQCDLIEMF